ncbi:hypothetical protein HYC85_027185 [Camellia sinensis]|uniref:RWP-RK domain-containing protein n=1 Tax=Camellia sinensis TaxID=4442 RepID=A0A7J7G9R8_CAMSI|nr:hypothetical protein HYC85_027185 [Camellia sinensis]
MENGEEMVWLDLSNQQLPKVDAIDSGNNVVIYTKENNIAVTSVQQNCIINLSQRQQRKAGIPINLEDLRQRFGMRLKDAAESLGVSRSKVKRACREYNITWWSPCKRSKDNHSLSNKLVQGSVQEQIQEPSQPPISDPPRKQDMATTSRPKPRFMAEQDTSTVTIKVKYRDDFIKFQLPVLSGMVEFQQHVAKRLNLQVASVEYGRVNLDMTGRNALMLAGNLVSILTGGEKSKLLAEDFKEEKLIRATAWIVKWGVGFTVVIVLLWPLLSLPAGQFSKGYFTFWAIITIAWSTIGSAVIIVFPLTECWQTIQSVILGMFTNDRLMEKVEELNLKLHTIMLAIPEAERNYLLEKGKAKKNEASEPDAYIVPT